MLVEIVQSHDETAANDGFGDVMAALPNPLLHPRNSLIGVIELQEDQLNPVSSPLPIPYIPKVDTPRKCCLKGKADARPKMTVQFSQHESTSLQGSGFWCEWCQSCRYQVSIHKHRAYGRTSS